MKLANFEQVQALDPEFGRMAAEVGRHAWSLPQLTMREKAFVFLAADLCTANVGFPLPTQVQMAGANGVSVPECIVAIRHLAPYAGYPTAAVALQQLHQQEQSDGPVARPGEPRELPQAAVDSLTELNADVAVFFADQFKQRWSGDDLSPRERALACLAADVLAKAAGAGPEQIDAVLLLVVEYGMAKAWRAYRALRER